MFNRYPALLLLAPFVSGMVFGILALIAWILKAAWSVRHDGSDDPRNRLLNLIPILMAAGGALFHLKDSPCCNHNLLIETDGVILDGPWRCEGFERPYEILLNNSLKARFLDIEDRDLHPGCKVKLKGRIVQKKGWVAIDTRAPLIQSLGHARTGFLFLWTYQARQKIWKGFQLGLGRKEAALAGAMMIGLTCKLPYQIKSHFRNIGCAHLLSISGLHLGLIVLFITFLLRVMGISEDQRFWPLVLFLCMFCFLTGWRIPVMRAFLVCFLHLLARRRHWPQDSFTPLFNACLLLLLWDPGALYEVSFQLSFAGYGSILCFFKVYHKLAPKISKSSWIKRGLSKALVCFGISLTTWIGTLPLVLYYFHMFNPLAPLFNLVVAPLFVGALLSCFLHGFASLMGLESQITAWPADLSCDLLMGAAAWLETLDPGVIRGIGAHF